MKVKEIVPYKDNIITKLRSMLSKNSGLQKQNPELYKYLRENFSESKTYMGVIKTKQFGSKQMDRITSLTLKDMKSLDGIEGLKNLEELNCTIDGKQDSDSYTRAYGLDSLKNRTLHISSPRDLENMDLSQLDDKTLIYDTDMSGRYTKDEIEQINTKLDEIKGQLTPDMSEKDKVEAIYRNLGNSIEFDDNPTSEIRARSLSGCLVDGKGVCSGYSKALRTVLNDNGIEAISCGGYGDGNEHEFDKGSGDHQWNQVKIDGNWYNCDLTFDSASDKEKFNRGEWGNFLKSDEVFSRNHTNDPSERQNNCTDTRYDGQYAQPESLDTTGLTREEPKQNKETEKTAFQQELKSKIATPEEIKQSDLARIEQQQIQQQVPQQQQVAPPPSIDGGMVI